MKKLVTLLMIILYSFSSSGATVQLHYCCGELQEITFGSVQEKDCGMQQEMTSKTCCETKSVSANDEKGEKEFYTITIGSKAPAEPVALANLDQSFSQTTPVVIEHPIHSSLQLSNPLFILNCVFRI